MPSVAPALRTSEQVRSEIEQTFGFFPPFYEPALASPQVLENLWQQTLSAYIENPLSALFKEKLNALLSRFCAAPYCIIVHSAALRPLGMTAQQVLALLDAPPSDPTTELPLGGLPVPTSEEATAPTPDSLLEKTLLYCATPVFLERADAPACQAELRRLLGPRLYSHLVAYLAYIKTCHTWIEAHPEVSHEADRRVQDNLGPLLAEEPALGDFFRHYQERVRAQGLGKERRRAADDTLRTEQARTARILESITDAFFALDHEWRFTFLNAQAERLLLRPRAELLGRNVWAEFPATVGTDFDRHYHHAVNAQTSVTFEAYYPPPLDTWFEVRAFPSPEGLSVFFHDITERVGRRQRERFLAELAERARRLTDPDEVIADAVRSVGAFLGVSRCLFADIDIEADTCSVPPHYRADESVASIAGVFPISAFGPFVVAEYQAGRTAVVDDVRADRVKAPPESLAAYEAIGVRAYVAAPVLHSARLVSALAVHSPVPRHWKAEEVELLQTVVERTWLTVEVTRQNRTLVRVAEEQRVRAEREALLNRIGQALRSSPDPETVLEAAVRELGGALGADRCYFAAYDQDADTATVGPEWHQDGLPSIAGQYPMSGFAVNRDPVYKAGRTQVVADTAGDPATEALGLRALVRVPLVSGASMIALSVAMASGPRQWTPAEVSLVEAVATQTQSALETMRVRQREHRIAEQLQDALQPSLPEYVPGLSVGKYTKPALDEAQIGGDFYDIFPLDKELFAIVIADVSGKGLAAAQQLALIRNSLRTVLYLYRAPAQAASALNKIVTSHELLVDFVTAWVGVYAAGTGEITYCSCGHEPGLIRRADGEMEQTETTGPPLGVAENAEYGEKTVTLSSGDALLLYTDGLSEAGPNRREMLGTDGLMRFLASSPVDLDAQAGTETLVAQVSEATDGIFRDDVAVLLMRRE